MKKLQADEHFERSCKGRVGLVSEQYQGIKGVLFLRPLFCENFNHFDGCISWQIFVSVPLLCIGNNFVCGVK